jgi:hypothetical protein
MQPCSRLKARQAPDVIMDVTVALIAIAVSFGPCLHNQQELLREHTGTNRMRLDLCTERAPLLHGGRRLQLFRLHRLQVIYYIDRHGVSGSPDNQGSFASYAITT